MTSNDPTPPTYPAFGHAFQNSRRDAPSAPAAALVASVTVDGTSNDTLNWQFSQSVIDVTPTAAALEADDGSGMASPDLIGNVNQFVIVAQYTGKTFTTGNAWQMLTSPDPDITSAGGFVVPASGVTE